MNYIDMDIPDRFIYVFSQCKLKSYSFNYHISHFLRNNVGIENIDDNFTIELLDIFCYRYRNYPTRMITRNVVEEFISDHMRERLQR